MIDGLESSYGWNYEGLGGVITIPQNIIAATTRLVTGVSIVWGKSPALVGTVTAIMVLQQVASHSLTLLVDMIGTWTCPSGLTGKKVDYDMWDIRDAVSNFEDMRVNAKERDILRDIHKIKNSEDVVDEDLYGRYCSQLFRPLQRVSLHRHRRQQALHCAAAINYWRTS